MPVWARHEVRRKHPGLAKICLVLEWARGPRSFVLPPHQLHNLCPRWVWQQECPLVSPQPLPWPMVTPLALAAAPGL